MTELPFIVFDVNETLLDLASHQPSSVSLAYVLLCGHGSPSSYFIPKH
jgi:hypothetical protein